MNYPGAEHAGYPGFRRRQRGASPPAPDRQGAGAVEMIFRIAENHFVTFKADPKGPGIEPNGTNREKRIAAE